MARRPFAPFTRVREMLGKQPQSPWANGFNMVLTAFGTWFNHKTKFSDLRSNYALFRALYFSSQPDDIKIDESFIMGAGFAKPIVNSTVAFALGTGFKVKIPGATEGGGLQTSQQALQDWVDATFDKWLDWTKYGTRDGDGYMFVDEVGNIGHLKPETVEVIVDPVSGNLLGYDVTELIEEKDTSTGQKNKYTYVRKYRRTHTTIIRVKENEPLDKGTIVYERVFAIDGEIDTQADLDENGAPRPLDLLPEELEERPLPIVHFINEPEPGFLYGNSELQNVLIYMRNYGEVLDAASKRDVYNSKPIAVFTGVTNPKDNPQTKDSLPKDVDGNPQLNWQDNQTLFLHSKDAKAAYMQVPNTMENSGKLLEYLFYCIVQASETPEFVLGTAVSSSKASVQEQMPVVVQKAQRKRGQLRSAFRELINLYVYRQLQLSNPKYFPLRDIKPEYDIVFPDIVDEDKTLNVQIVQALLDAGAIGNSDARDILLSGRFDDDTDVDARGMADLASRTNAGGTLPDTSRLNDELDSGTGE